MKISYINFWPQSNKIEDFWLSNFCKQIFKDNAITLVNSNNNPDILFCSCFGNINNIINTQAKIKIFFTGENVLRDCYSDYNNHQLMNKIFDLQLGFHYTDINNKKIRLPLWLIFFNYYSMNNEDNLLTFITKKRRDNLNEKKFLGSLVCRHDRNGLRMKIFNELSKYGVVYSAGAFNNNYKNIGKSWDDKINFIKQSIFNICPENSQNEGYCTEKIFHALIGGCIPLYWGSDIPEKNLLNIKSYVMLDNENHNNLNNQIKYAVENKNDYLQENIFTQHADYILDNYYRTFEWQLKYKLNMIPKQKIYGISYASRNFRGRLKQNEVYKNCGLFDIFNMYNENDIDKNFIEENKEIWYNSSRGGGWWIWKPYIIYQQLLSINENDILVYFDGGCTLINNIQSKKRFNDYINYINNHWTGLLRFELKYKEKDYTNKYTFNFFKNRYNIDEENMKKYNETFQLVGGIQIIRKNKFSMDFFRDILKILRVDKEIFTEKYTLQKEIHRHDQSIMSILYKVMGGDLIIPDETWFGFGGRLGNDNFGSELSKKYPFWATRLQN